MAVPRYRMRVRDIYTHRISEYIVASLIMGNFVSNAAEAQVRFEFNLSVIWYRVLPTWTRELNPTIEK